MKAWIAIRLFAQRKARQRARQCRRAQILSDREKRATETDLELRNDQVKFLGEQILDLREQLSEERCQRQVHEKTIDYLNKLVDVAIARTEKWEAIEHRVKNEAAFGDNANVRSIPQYDAE